MYKNEFQGGPAVDVFGANGKDPLNKWKNPAVHRIYEKEAKGYVYSLEGSTATAKLSFPVKEQFRQNLCLIQRYLSSVGAVAIQQNSNFLSKTIYACKYY